MSQKYLVAVSGGVDSVVLLHRLVMLGKYELVVAHFDHGIREDSVDDARFAEGLAVRYDVPFVTMREELGTAASEEHARNRRYAFLCDQARRHNAVVVTAHHQDDVIETIAINLKRGTGWRGAAVLDSPKIVRPLRTIPKSEIRRYALKHRLEWVEDSTNTSDRYLRNRLRQRLASELSPEHRQSLVAIWQRQLKLKAAIDTELSEYSNQSEQSRYYLTHIDEQTAIELLRAMIVAKTHQSPTRPQLARALLAIKTAKSGTKHEIGAGVTLRFTTRTFIVETP